MISIELVELELANQKDFLLVRDGQHPSDSLLATFTGSITQFEDKRHLSSTSNKLYLYLKTEHSPYLSSSKNPFSFAIRFRTGCDVNLVAHNGTVTSPAFQIGRYPLNQNCVYRLARPDSQGGLTLRLDELDLSQDDQLIAYDGHDTLSQRIHIQQQQQNLNQQTNSGKLQKAQIKWLTAPSGKMMLVFSSSPVPNGIPQQQALDSSNNNNNNSIKSKSNRGFYATFSSDCPPLKLGKNVQVLQGLQVANSSAKFGQLLTYSCPRGQEFSNGQLKLYNECLPGGKWSLARVPNCQPKYCGPVPQIDNGFAINSTGVTYNQTATYRCYNGFNLASGKQTETISCLENGFWAKLPECFSTSCPALREVPNSKILLLAGSSQTRHYGTVVRFECEPGYQRVGVPSILCTSSGTWSSSPPECLRAQCRQLPHIEHGYLVETDTKQPIQSNRKFLYLDEARVQCYRGYKLDTSHLSQQQQSLAGLIKCGTNQTFDYIPRCLDVDECQLATSCDSASTQCKNLPGGYQCECKQGYAPNLECKQPVDLGLANNQLPDSAIWVSSTAPNFSKNNLRLFRSGWCGNSQIASENLVRIDLQSVSIIRGLKIQPVTLSATTSQTLPPPSSGNAQPAPVHAFPSLFRLRYTNNLTDGFRDHQDVSKRNVQFRLTNLNVAGIFHVNLPTPIEARYLEIVMAEYQGAPCMKLEIQGCIGQSCLDINECADNNGGCSHRCINTAGSFNCACDRGHDLYTQNGTHGFFIAPNESGIRDGDLYRLNKTCVPKQCPTLSDPTNGQLLTTQRLFHFGDTVKFKCNFGYVMSSSSSQLSCGPNGQWNGSIPECNQAKCKPLSNDRAQGLSARYEPNSGKSASDFPQSSTTSSPQSTLSDYLYIDNDGQLPFLANMSISCRESGRQLRQTASANFRQCVYNIRNDTGRGDYWFSGTPPACPKIDCGVPQPTPGATPYQYTDTKFGSSFFFGCEENYSLAGSSRSGNVVSCRADGSWDFGDLRCEGPVCQDPGRAPDGDQIATSYEPGSQVNFRCKRQGYVPYTTDPLVCSRNADCKVIKPLGLSYGTIPDRSINATSYRDNYEPAKVRLGSSTGWCAKITETMPFITVDLGRPYKIKALLIKGVVTVDVVGRPLEVRIFYRKPSSQDSILVYPNFNLTTHVDLLQQQLGLANYGELSYLQLPQGIIAQSIGINIIKSIKNPCMRFEVLGCEANDSPSGISSTNQLGYEQPVPVCVDQEPPQFSSCPDQPIVVERGAYGELLPVNFTVPQATDNSGLVARLEVRPKGFRPGQYVFHDQQAHYVASDNDGNVAICSINITVPDVTPPKLICPSSHIHYLKVTGPSTSANSVAQQPVSHFFDFAQLVRDKIRALDESGPVSLEMQPASATIAVNQFENVTVYARDRFNNTAQCNFQVQLRTPTCSEQSLVAPANGQLECLPQSDPQTGLMSAQLFQCVATCNEGYRFLDGRKAQTYVCDNSQSIPPQVQDCVPNVADDSAYEVLATINYKLVWPQNSAKEPFNPDALADCMTNYTDLVRQYALDLQEVLSSRCTVLNGDTNVEFKSIRGYQRPIVRAQQEELVAIQFEMRVDSKIKKGPIFGLCGQSIRQTFDLRLPASTAIQALLNINMSSIPLSENSAAPELDLFSSGICPSLVAASSSTAAGYRCTPGFMLTNQSSSTNGDQSDEFSSLAEMDVPICLQCPAGSYGLSVELGTKTSLPNGGSQCKLCPRGFYQDQQAQAECKQCPKLTSTLLEGAKSINDCQPVCAFGYYSATGLAPCNQCPPNSFTAAPIHSSNGLSVPTGYDECVKCPVHKPFTYAAGSSSPSECRNRCQPGTYSDTGLEPCSPCPLNFYQSNEGAIQCDECPMGNRTMKRGASSSEHCVQSSCIPTLNPITSGPCLPESDEAQSGKCFAGCQQNGVCTIQLHEPQCHCPAGFKGKFCEIEINECSQEPCHNGGACIDLKQGYRCKCPSGYSGLQCQIEQSDCKNDTCPERSMCQDLPGINNFTCLCRSGYTGPNCNITLNPCDITTKSPGSEPLDSQSSQAGLSQSPCQNGAQCIPLQQGRYKCACEPGWTGPNCEQNVDDCAEEPCLVGAKCTDLINDFRCDCPSGFTGKRCHEKVDQCSGNPCGKNGLCVDRSFDFECICKPGWRGERCNQTMDACSTNPCLNNGECINLAAVRAGLEQESSDMQNPTTKGPSITELNQFSNQTTALPELAALEQQQFMCQCEPRFTGSRCQHNVNSCEINRCEHGGTCIDTLDGFECKCKPGFVGLNCEAQVKECAAEPCNSVGTLECQDQINGHKCVCLPGYTGDKCEVEIDECQSDPCQNGAKCEDKINDYSCLCPPGWTGKNCDLELGKCAQEQPCLNNAKCVDLFEDYFCICPSGTDGKRCQTSPRRCIGDPCQNGGQCHDYGSGLNCTCPSRFTSFGCQHVHEPCAPGNDVCKNGATCIELTSSAPNGSPDYQCICPPGWQGKHCDQDIPDCGPNSCALNAQCVDLNNRYYCKCPPGWTGDDCRKPLSSDFDLAFNGLSKSGSAGQSIPFEIANGQPVKSMTLGLWVQFTNNQVGVSSNLDPLSAQPSLINTASSSLIGGHIGDRNPKNLDEQSANSGVFLTLYSSESSQRLVKKRELIKFDHNGVRISILPNQTAIFLPYLQTVPINDGQWHHLNIIWDSQSGNVTLTTDSAVAAIKQNYAQSESLDNYARYGYINLGAELDHNQLAIENSGFQGRISRVSFWSRALDVNSEIPKQFRSCKQIGSQQSDQIGLVSYWAGYDFLQGNVERQQPSECGQRVCPMGLTGDECAILQQDKQAPEVLICPPDMWVISSNSSTSVDWDEPHFVDDLAKPVAVAEQNNLKPGASFSHGVYDLSYIAVDESGNTARCDFQIRVLKEFCPMPLAPINGRANCKTWGPDGRFRTCSIECQDGYEFSQPVSQNYVCGAEGFWRPTVDPDRELVYPACTAKHSAQRIYRLSVNFASAAVCSESGKRILNSRIHENLLKIDQNWKLCSQSSSKEERGRCEHLKVQVKCAKQPVPSQLNSNNVGVSSQMMPNRGAMIRSRRSNEFSDRSQALPQSLPLGSSDPRTQPQQHEDLYVVEVSFPANADPIVSANTGKLKRNITDILHDAIFKDSILDVHQTLPNVQPDINSLELSNEYACEPGTVVVGSACVECAQGSYYDDSTRSCVECPISTYQDETRKTQCKPCPNINSKPGVTSGTGVRTADQCKERCPVGKRYDDQAGFCRSCGHGFYQPSEGSFSCIACGPGLTTRSQEASSRHECRPECEPGQQLSQLGACEPCPQGWFRSRGRPACEQCPAGYTTETSGSMERRQCSLLLCPAGHYLNATTDRCHECPRGYYQPNQQRDTQCLSCPSDMSTDHEGSTSSDNCTNPCFVNGQAQLCQANSYCVFNRDSQNYTCECKPKYRMNDDEQCVYVCDDYCLNGGTCSATNENNNRPRCDCPASFYGERCERKSDFIYVATGIAIGLAIILFMILVVWMICVRTTSSSSSSMSHIAAHPTKQGLHPLHAASQLDFASQLAVAAAASMPSAGGTHPSAAFYYGNGYAESIAPSHQSAYAHYYDDEDEEIDNQGMLPGQLPIHLDPQSQANIGHWDPNNNPNAFYQDNYQLKDGSLLNGMRETKANGSNLYSLHAGNLAQDQQLIDLQPQQQISDKDELYDRLKRHLYTGQKGDSTDSGEEAH